MSNDYNKISDKHNVAELIGAVPPIHKAVQPSFKFSHNLTFQ